jgi:hypothetical protein
MSNYSPPYPSYKHPSNKAIRKPKTGPSIAKVIRISNEEREKRKIAEERRIRNLETTVIEFDIPQGTTIDIDILQTTTTISYEKQRKYKKCKKPKLEKSLPVRVEPIPLRIPYTQANLELLYGLFHIDANSATYARGIKGKPVSINRKTGQIIGSCVLTGKKCGERVPAVCHECRAYSEYFASRSYNPNP